jgi:hypothetical protein
MSMTTANRGAGTLRIYVHQSVRSWYVWPTGGGVDVRILAVTARPATGGKPGNRHVTLPFENPSLRSRTSNVSIALATLHVSRRQSASIASLRSGSLTVVLLGVKN